MANNDRRNQHGKGGSWLFNPLNAAAAAWGTAVGIGCAILGIRRPGGRKETERAAGTLPERPEAPATPTPAQPGRSAEERQEKAAEPKPAPSAKVAPVAKAAGRRSATGADTRRRGARQAPPAKQGTAAKSPDLSDKGASQRPTAQRSASAGTRPTARTPARPKASDKRPAQPRPGQAAREEPPASAGSPAMAAADAGPQRPPALGGPRGGKADDLKQIAGIGPRLEEKLNGLGIYHYDQIAGWSDSGVAWIDAELQAKGRVKRDNWVGQAAALMAGIKKTDGGPAA
jgi:predicted flap endonuclease-1-like 5' DNA nuclease